MRFAARISSRNASASSSVSTWARLAMKRLFFSSISATARPSMVVYELIRFLISNGHLKQVYFFAQVARRLAADGALVAHRLNLLKLDTQGVCLHIGHARLDHLDLLRVHAL